MSKLRENMYCIILSCVFAIITCASENPNKIPSQKADYQKLIQKREQLKKERLPVLIDPKSLVSGSLEFWTFMRLSRDIDDINEELKAMRVDLENNKIEKSDE